MRLLLRHDQTAPALWIGSVIEEQIPSECTKSASILYLGMVHTKRQWVDPVRNRPHSNYNRRLIYGPFCSPTTCNTGEDGHEGGILALARLQAIVFPHIKFVVAWHKQTLDRLNAGPLPFLDVTMRSALSARCGVARRLMATLVDS